jgi:hypothetical protein
MAFSAQVLINGVDYYNLLTDEISIDIEEGGARLAEFVLDPLPGPIDPYEWIGQAVEIYYLDGVNPAALVFTGLVHAAPYDIDTGLTKFSCTDGLQEAFELVARPAIDALIPGGLWSDKIFRSTRDNWDYAQQRISAYPGHLSKSPAGAVRVTAWAAKASADYTYTAANIDSESLKIDQLAERRNITNAVKIVYTSGFQLLRQREQAISWAADGVTPWGMYLSKSFPLPERQAIEDSLKDWALKDITYTDLPASGVWSYLGQDYGWILSDYGRTQCQGFAATIAARWRQDVAAEYTITVSSAASIAQHGSLQIEQRYNVNHKNKGRGDDFLKFDTYKAPEGSLIYSAGSSSEYGKSTQGDDSLPQLVAVSIAKVKILKSHRENRVVWECALNPGLDLDKTVAIDHPKLTAKGKVYAVRHRINVLEGFAISRCTIAISRPNVAGQVETALTRATVPAAAVALDFTPGATPPAFSALGQYLGRDESSAVEDQAWNGWVSNYPFWSGVGTPPPVYDPARFQVTTPEIDATDYNAWLNDQTELQTRLVKSGAAYYQRVYFNGEPIAAGDTLTLYDGDTLKDTHTILTADLEAGYYQIAALEARQDEHSITHLINAAFNVAIPQDDLVIYK